MDDRPEKPERQLQVKLFFLGEGLLLLAGFVKAYVRNYIDIIQVVANEHNLDFSVVEEGYAEGGRECYDAKLKTTGTSFDKLAFYLELKDKCPELFTPYF